MTASTVENALPTSVVTALYVRTRALHLQAERTGIMRSLLCGDASRNGYGLLLRNLLPVYREIENGLARHSGSAMLGALAGFRLDRASAIESDLTALFGARWSEDVPLLAEGQLYANRVAEVAKGDGAGLIAHAYTRYLGDLNGGQILRRLLAHSLEMQPGELSFYDYQRFADLDAFKAEYRKALDQAAALAPDPHAVIEEGAMAFSLNIDLSCSIQTIVTGSAGTPAAEQAIAAGH